MRPSVRSFALSLVAGVLGLSLLGTAPAQAGPQPSPAKSPASVGAPATAEARAGGVAVNQRRIYLRFPAPNGARACTTRKIDLAAGRYRWTQIGGATREYDLRKGRYYWKDCIEYHITPSYDWVYARHSTLQNDTGGTVSLPGTLQYGSSGWYWFGSHLLRL
ncbi:hypothetical protein E1212_09770 [Jiangella ureilytica]|uniref:Uncharacterized protein n=1 Tax=Jiangella ureilytica TaxID=2530374 RepID=A0A4R4RQE6_9ACTN|nr:hypothetical protein [Jiangella ureilytica]TDC52118.1 hypothetical protein E1212_09770 [Jiangella ureilytica]